MTIWMQSLNNNGKTCGECKECCRGAVSVEVPGAHVKDGKICPHLDESAGNHGCKIYATRPDQCSKYSCWWLGEKDAPDFMRPDRSKVLVTWRKLNNCDEYYLDVVTITGCEMPYDGLSSMIRYAVLKNANIMWRHRSYDKSGKIFWLGNPNFEEKCKELIVEKKTK